VADAVVDASVWVSRLLTRDIHHARSRSWLDRQMAEGALLIAPALMPWRAVSTSPSSRAIDSEVPLLVP